MSLGQQITIDQLDDDPFPIYARLRRDEPVCWVPATHATWITRWDDVLRVARDEQVFSAAVHDSPLTTAIGPNLLHSDGRPHADRRLPLTARLRPSAIRTRMAAVIDREVAHLLDGLGERTQADLVADFAQPLAVRVLLDVAGLPAVPVATAVRWLAGIAAGAANYERDAGKAAQADAVGTEVDAIVRTELERGPAPDSLLEGLASTQLGLADICATIKVLIIGGMQEPRDLFGSALAAYLTSGRVRDAVDSRPDGIDRLIEEALRWGSPVGTVTRRVTESVEISGTWLEPGTVVAAVLASANRDERHWERPDEFDILRGDHQHLAFGAGVHACVGAMLARAQVRAALQAVLRNLVGLELTAEPISQGWEFRGPCALPVRWQRRTAQPARVPIRTLPADTRQLRVVDRRQEAVGIISITLADARGEPLPSWEAGAHIDVHVPGSKVRQYSLCGNPDDRDRWQIAVQLDRSGRGGSRWLHEHLLLDRFVTVGGPRNNFRLKPATERLFIAGGIGITPLLPMIGASERDQVPWRLLYLGHDKRRLAFFDELSRYGERVRIWLTGQHGRPDLRDMPPPAEGGTVYCCGPASLIDAVEQRDWHGAPVRVERFAPIPNTASPKTNHAFDIELARTGAIVRVPADLSALSALEDAGVLIPSTCREGICGSCELPVLLGEIDHRDSVLDEDERRAGKVMLACVSRSAGDRLVVDI